MAGSFRLPPRLVDVGAFGLTQRNVNLPSHIIENTVHCNYCGSLWGAQMRLLVLAASVILIVSHTMAMANDDDYKVSKMHLERTQQAKNLLNGITDIKNSPVAMVAINAAASYLEVSPAVVTIALKAIPTGSVAGEEGHYFVPVEPGYKYCRSRSTVISINPPSGNRASVLNATAGDTGISIYTWTPRKGLGGGRSWVEAEFELTSVRNDLYDQSVKAGICKPAKGRALLRCKGNCGSVAD